MIRFPLLLGALALGLPAHAAPGDPKVQVGRANDAARVQPERATFQGAIQKYAWADGALFQIYTAPGQVTDIALQEGEELVGPGPVAAGDTVRWIIGDTLSGAGVSRRVHRRCYSGCAHHGHTLRPARSDQRSGHAECFR